MDHFLILWRLQQIALLKSCAAAAPYVFDADEGTYSVINEDYIIDDHQTT
jgi:hypothetical protein